MFYPCDWAAVRYLNLFTFYSNTLPTWKKKSNVSQQENGGLVLADAASILTTSHLNANHPRAYWRSGSDEANSTTLSAKNREAIVRIPSRHSFSSWL